MTFKTKDGRELFAYGDDPKQLKPGLYIGLFHGRNSPDEILDDWGFAGPVIGPVDYAHMTYACDLKFSMSAEDFERYFPEVATDWKAKGCTPADEFDHYLPVQNGLVVFDGCYFGDFTVFHRPG